LSVASALLILVAQSAQAQDLGASKKLYVNNCLRCHGAKGGGGVGKRLAGDAAYWDSPIFKRTITADRSEPPTASPAGVRPCRRRNGRECCR
jgi:mono/diheme cytochrome c family protein